MTEDALHMAVVAYDVEPLEIITTDSRRDSSLDNTDSFRVIIDRFLGRWNGYVFGTNSAGLEFDGQVTREAAGQFSPGGSDGLNLNWDAPWIVRAADSDIDWSAKMETPFTSLRIETGQEQVWGFNFERRNCRNNEIAFWAPVSQERNLYRVSEAGSIAGIDLKYSITPSITLDATYNTDFAQVEVDDQQVNLDRFSLFFPEKRPFFLENAGQFTVGTPREVELFFSRRIGIVNGTQTPISGGLRLSGKLVATTIETGPMQSMVVGA